MYIYLHIYAALMDMADVLKKVLRLFNGVPEGDEPSPAPQSYRKGGSSMPFFHSLCCMDELPLSML